MPIYEFYCNDCDQEFEFLIIGNSSEKPYCVLCESRNVRRMMSACSYKSKGSGGEITSSTPSSSSCSGCSAASCAGCGS